MKISAVSTNLTRPKSFKGHFETKIITEPDGFSRCSKVYIPEGNDLKGHWENRSCLLSNGQYYTERVYVPFKDESAESIAAAWKFATGRLPHDWVTKNNTYASSKDGDNSVVYKIKDNAYMPIEVLKASILLADKAKFDFGAQEKLNSLISLAKLEKQAGNEKAVENLEKDMIKTIPDVSGSKYLLIAQQRLDEYKDGFGTKFVNMYTYSPNEFNSLLEKLSQ